LPGVGEALKREIAGLGLVGWFWLWGFAVEARFGFALLHEGLGVFWVDLSRWFAIFWPICAARHDVLGLSRSRPHGWAHTYGAAGNVACGCGCNFRCAGRAFHAAALAVVGGALGCCAGAIVSMMTS